MSKGYEKICYDSQSGFRLHHTLGHNAGASTLGYLHTIDTYMLIYFIRGTGNIKVEGNSFDIHEGDLILLNPTELFHCSVDDAAYHERIVLYIQKDILRGTPYNSTELFRPFSSLPVGVGNHQPASDLERLGIHMEFKELLLAFQKSADTFLAFAKTITILAKLHAISVLEIAPHSEATKSKLIADVLHYLNDHYKEDIHIEDIATVFNLNKSYLAHQFKSHVGMSLWNYVILKRLYAFNELIREGSFIEDACWRVGFQNYSNFFRLYKKHMGITPMQFKKQFKDK